MTRQASRQPSRQAKAALQAAKVVAETQQQEREASPDGQEAHELRGAINRIASAIREHNVQLDIGLLNTTAQANAACMVLVEAGIISGDHMDVLILRNVKGMLAQTLQAVEETRLREQQQASGVQVVERPKLVVATH